MKTRRRLSREERKAILAKTDGHCAYCGCKLAYKDMQVDHVNSIARGGEDSISNMLPACRSCNHYKSTLTLEEFRNNVQRWPEILIRDSVTYKNAVRFGVVIPNPHPVMFYFERCDKNG